MASDLSAAVYGGRMALAAMAQETGRAADAARWLDSATAIRKLIADRLYAIDSRDPFVRIRGDAITRVLGEHVTGSALFDEVYRRQLHNPSAFWTPYPPLRSPRVGPAKRSPRCALRGGRSTTASTPISRT